MFSFVPSSIYYEIYIYLCLFLVLFTLLHTRLLELDDQKNINFIKFFGYFLLFSLILYIGQRPIYAIFGDTVNYNVAYNNYALGKKVGNVDDYGWHVFMKFMSSITTIHTFFTIVAIVYIYPMYKISKVYFGDFWYYSFVLFIVSFSFWTYGVNGMRNGAALSLFLWGVAYSSNKKLMALFFLLAAMFHKTALLPIAAYGLTYYFNNPKIYFKSWLACIPLSLVFGSIFIIIFSKIGFGGDDRLSGYLTKQSAEGTFSSTGFRWDFLFYSAFPVFAGWYFVIKRKFEDPVYFRLLNTYLICNSFWILVIKANYSNRFAYLSWFMMAIVIIYPILKEDFFKNQHLMIGKIMLIYFGFTFFMFKFFY
ncbi:EpsG family protein [Pseudotamlana agarivorans]|uniref:EpsG family protein n=1 Tax=Pseudotamlana agarivorans TaxID=481183 RepID=UPI00082CF7DF|nr:EpsG family protein [Tamlana agarivorans]